ncbi:MAG: pirin family protein [Xanthomonadales bacterium]|nr:pirin family protein [Xanthomonadales bacterium]
MIKRHTAAAMKEGSGVNVKRLMPLSNFRNYDPFVLWDEFIITPGNGFPTHPHRGFEAITYLFTGSINHADNLGNNSTVTGGGAQRFTAGRGLEHSEMPHDHDSTRGIQLWINLPKRLKQVDPSYQQVNHEDFPVVESAGLRIKVLVGDNSPLKIMTPMRYLEINLNSDVQHTENIPEGMRGFIYVVDGQIDINGQSYVAGESAFFKNEMQITLKAKEQSHIMLAYGLPHGEPIKQWGPYVD